MLVEKFLVMESFLITLCYEDNCQSVSRITVRISSEKIMRFMKTTLTC